MNDSQRPAAPRVSAAIIHTAMALGVLTFFAVVAWLTVRGGVEGPREGTEILRYVGYFLILGSAVAAFGLRSRFPAPGAGEDLNQWWLGAINRAIVIWAVAEGGALAGIALGLVTGSMGLAATGTLATLVVFFLTRPGALERPV